MRGGRGGPRGGARGGGAPGQKGGARVVIVSQERLPKRTSRC